MLPLAIAAAATAGTAIAATPESGTVGPTTERTDWTGTVSDPLGAYDIGTFFYGETAGTCVAPVCDTFTLTVEGGGSTLYLEIDAAQSENVAVEIEKPDGSIQYENSAELVTKRQITIKNAKPGEYAVRTFGTGEFDYKAFARYGANAVPAKPAPVAPEPSATPAPSATPSPTPQAQPQPKLTVSAKGLSAKKLAKAKKLTASVSSSAEVTKVRVLLSRGAKPGGKVIAQASLAKLNGKAKATLKVKSKPKAGKHTLLVEGIDAQGRRVVAGRTVTLKK
jgi:hypothetical protein